MSMTVERRMARFVICVNVCRDLSYIPSSLRKDERMGLFLLGPHKEEEEEEEEVVYILKHGDVKNPSCPYNHHQTNIHYVYFICTIDLSNTISYTFR